MTENWNNYADTNWLGSGTADDPYQISTAAQLAGISASTSTELNNDYQDYYFKQTANINLGGKMWTPIKTFRGAYDGSGYSISGMFVESESNMSGLFAWTWTADLYNINLKNSVVKTTNKYCGGIVGYLEFGRAINCTSDCQVVYTGTAENTGISHGGVVGDASYGAIIQDCVNYGNVKTDKNVADVGGIVGWTGGDDGETGPVKVIGCINYGTVESVGNYIGGIAGSINNGTIIDGCHNYGNVSAKEHGVGGITGYSDGSTIKNCISDAMVSSKEYVGGILGSSWSENGQTTVENCAVYGLLYIDSAETTAYVGGILGGLPNRTKPFNMINCSVDAVCNQGAYIFAGQTEELTGLNIDSCYGQINETKQYTSGDFSEFGIVPNLNGGLPIHRSFYHVAQFSPALSLTWFSENGYDKVY